MKVLNSPLSLFLRERIFALGGPFYARSLDCGLWDQPSLPKLLVIIFRLLTEADS